MHDSKKIIEKFNNQDYYQNLLEFKISKPFDILSPPSKFSALQTPTEVSLPHFSLHQKICDFLDNSSLLPSHSDRLDSPSSAAIKSRLCRLSSWYHKKEEHHNISELPSDPTSSTNSELTRQIREAYKINFFSSFTDQSALINSNELGAICLYPFQKAIQQYFAAVQWQQSMIAYA